MPSCLHGWTAEVAHCTYEAFYANLSRLSAYTYTLQYRRVCHLSKETIYKWKHANITCFNRYQVHAKARQKKIIFEDFNINIGEKNRQNKSIKKTSGVSVDYKTWQFNNTIKPKHEKTEAQIEVIITWRNNEENLKFREKLYVSKASDDKGPSSLILLEYSSCLARKILRLLNSCSSSFASSWSVFSYLSSKTCKHKLSS